MRRRSDLFATAEKHFTFICQVIVYYSFIATEWCHLLVAVLISTQKIFIYFQRQGVVLPSCESPYPHIKYIYLLSSLGCGVPFLRQSLSTQRRFFLTLTQSINGQNHVFLSDDKSQMFQSTFTSLSDWSILVDGSVDNRNP